MKTLDFQVLEEQEVSKEVPALRAECLFEKEYRELRMQPLNSMLSGCYLAVNFWRNLSNGNYIGLSVGMSGYDFFHPDHIVPTAELISTFMEFADHGVAKMFVEANAVMVQVFVIHNRTGDAGI